MFYKADFECPFCGESFSVDIDGNDCFEEPHCGDSVFCECSKCNKLGVFEILAVTTDPEI